MNTKPTITIGIPAYNEEHNIKPLLESLLSQKLDIAELTKILVISDASRDNTAVIAESVQDSRITIVTKNQREGTYKAQNHIIKMTDTDILVIINADTMPANKLFLEELIRPLIQDSSVTLTAPYTIAASPRTFLEKILVHSHILKRSWYLDINNGNNIYMCYGVARAFARQFYSNLEWPMDIPEDAYSYFACITQGWYFVCSKKSILFFRTTSVWSDHLAQSTRFFGGKQKMFKIFPEEIVRKEYRIPLPVKIKRTWQSFLDAPVLTIAYTVIGSYIWLFVPKNYQTKWQIAVSTKESINQSDIDNILK